VVQSGIQVLIWAGDAGKNPFLSHTSSDPFSRSFFSSTHTDWICNTAGVQAVIAKIQYAESAQFNSESLVPYTVNGVQYGTFKTAGKLSFLNVFEAGHEIPAYQPVVALQAFIQTISQQPLSST
jgi:carboxypeptidase C (cathepsin A)